MIFLKILKLKRDINFKLIFGLVTTCFGKKHSFASGGYDRLDVSVRGDIIKNDKFIVGADDNTYGLNESNMEFVNTDAGFYTKKIKVETNIDLEINGFIYDPDNLHRY